MRYKGEEKQKRLVRRFRYGKKSAPIVTAIIEGRSDAGGWLRGETEQASAESKRRQPAEGERSRFF